MEDEPNEASLINLLNVNYAMVCLSVKNYYLNRYNKSSKRYKITKHRGKVTFNRWYHSHIALFIGDDSQKGRHSKLFWEKCWYDKTYCAYSDLPVKHILQKNSPFWLLFEGASVVAVVVVVKKEEAVEKPSKQHCAINLPGRCTVSDIFSKDEVVVLSNFWYGFHA